MYRAENSVKPLHLCACSCAHARGWCDFFVFCLLFSTFMRVCVCTSIYRSFPFSFLFFFPFFLVPLPLSTKPLVLTLSLSHSLSLHFLWKSEPAGCRFERKKPFNTFRQLKSCSRQKKFEFPAPFDWHFSFPTNQWHVVGHGQQSSATMGNFVCFWLPQNAWFMLFRDKNKCLGSLDLSVFFGLAVDNNRQIPMFSLRAGSVLNRNVMQNPRNSKKSLKKNLCIQIQTVKVCFFFLNKNIKTFSQIFFPPDHAATQRRFV